MDSCIYASSILLWVRVNARDSKNVDTPCKVQHSSSDQWTSSGVSVSDHATRAACMHTRFQRCFRSQPLIIQQASALGFIRSVAPSVCAVSLGSRTVQLERFGIAQLIFFPREFFWFWAKNCFSPQKIPYVAILYCLGWLVVWLWFRTTFRDVCQYDFLTVALRLDLA